MCRFDAVLPQQRGSWPEFGCGAEEEMVVFLIAQLEQRGDYDPRMFVAQQLASLGPVAAPAIPSLRSLHGSKEEEEAAAAAVKTIQAARLKRSANE